MDLSGKGPLGPAIHVIEERFVIIHVLYCRENRELYFYFVS